MSRIRDLVFHIKGAVVDNAISYWVGGLALFAFCASAPVVAQQSASAGTANSGVHENGVGPDPDGDTNPATQTRGVAFVADGVSAEETPPYPIIRFEPPNGAHGAALKDKAFKDDGVRFSAGLSLQECRARRNFREKTLCTYPAAASGQYAGGYANDDGEALTITFDKPVCLVTMALYPTGGEEDEEFVMKINGASEDGEMLEASNVAFPWRANTVRWKNMAGVYFTGAKAKGVSVLVRSATETDRIEPVRFLIDDIAYVSDNCADALKNVSKRTGLDLRPERFSLNRGEDT